MSQKNILPNIKTGTYTIDLIDSRIRDARGEQSERQAHHGIQGKRRSCRRQLRRRTSRLYIAAAPRADASTSTR